MTYVDYSKTKYCRRCDIRVDKSKYRCPWCNGALAWRPLVNRRLNGQIRTDKRKAPKVEGGNPDALGVVRDLPTLPPIPIKLSMPEWGVGQWTNAEWEHFCSEVRGK